MLIPLKYYFLPIIKEKCNCLRNIIKMNGKIIILVFFRRGCCSIRAEIESMKEKLKTVI